MKRNRWTIYSGMGGRNGPEYAPMASQEQVRTKIAIPLFRERVAPHFGVSSKILLVEMKGDAITQEATWDVGGEGALEIARRLVDLGVEKLICGGIQNRYKDWLTRRGVRVVDNQKGPARDLIQNVLHPIVREENEQWKCSSRS